MVLISCHPLGRTQPVMCSLLSSTLPPPTWDHPWGTSRLRLQLPLLSNPVVVMIFFSHSSMKDAVHIHHPFGCCSPPTLPTSSHHCPPLLLRRGYFLGTQPSSAAAHSFLSADCRMSPSLTLFVLSAAKRERPEQNARLLLAASTSPSGPPSAPPYARL